MRWLSCSCSLFCQAGRIAHSRTPSYQSVSPRGPGCLEGAGAPDQAASRERASRSRTRRQKGTHVQPSRLVRVSAGARGASPALGSECLVSHGHGNQEDPRVVTAPLLGQCAFGAEEKGVHHAQVFRVLPRDRPAAGRVSPAAGGPCQPNSASREHGSGQAERQDGAASHALGCPLSSGGGFP